MSTREAKWATGEAEWWTTCMVAVGWKRIVGDRTRGCDQSRRSYGLIVVRFIRRLGRGDLSAALEAAILAVHLQDVHV